MEGRKVVRFGGGGWGRKMGVEGWGKVVDGRGLTKAQNHLIETASVKTGSMLIWDTGRYEILPYHRQVDTAMTDDEISSYPSSADDEATRPEQAASEQQTLGQAFRNVSFPIPLFSSHRSVSGSEILMEGLAEEDPATSSWSEIATRLYNNAPSILEG